MGFILGLPVLIEYAATGYIEHIPLGILATGVEVIVVVTLGLGLTLDSTIYHRRLDIERSLQHNTEPKFYRRSDRPSGGA